MNDPKIYVVILNYRQWQETRECLESILRSEYSDFEVLVIDNNSQNGSLRFLGDWMSDTYPDIRYHHLSKESINDKIFCDSAKVYFVQNSNNDGFASGNNLVLRYLKDKDAYIWLLNPDMLVKRDTMKELAQYTVRQSRKSIIGAEVRSNTGNHDLHFYGGGRVSFISATINLIKNKNDISRLDYISGGCLFTHAETFREIGLLPEQYFLYWEETDWCFNAKSKGYDLLVCPSAICLDKISTVIGKGFLADYYYARNGLLFTRKYRKESIPTVLMLMSVRFLKRIITGQWARAKGVLKGTIDYFKKPPDDHK